MSILVTGGTGFLGRHLVDRLRERFPGEELRVLVRRRPSAPDAAAAAEGAPPDAPPDAAAGPRPAPPAPLTLVEGDVLDRASLDRALAGVRLAFHLAGRVAFGEGASALYALHVGGTRNVLEAARAASVERVVYASTSGTVGISARLDHVAHEQSPFAFELARRFPYYHSKLLAERLALEAAREGAPVVIVSPALLLGPGDDAGSSSALITRYLRREIPAVPPGVAAIVDVRDAAAAFVAAAERGREGVRYLLGQNATMAELMALLEGASRVVRPLIEVPRAAQGLFGKAARLLGGVERALGRGGERAAELDMAGLSWAISCERAKADLGFAPRPLADTIADAVEWLRARPASQASPASQADTPAGGPEQPRGLADRLAAALGGR